MNNSDLLVAASLTRQIQTRTASGSNSTLYGQRARCYLKLHKVSKALVDAEMVIQLKPSSYLGFFLKGCALELADKKMEAMDAYHEALQCNKKLKEGLPAAQDPHTPKLRTLQEVSPLSDGQEIAGSSTRAQDTTSTTTTTCSATAITTTNTCTSSITANNNTNSTSSTSSTTTPELPASQSLAAEGPTPNTLGATSPPHSTRATAPSHNTFRKEESRTDGKNLDSGSGTQSSSAGSFPKSSSSPPEAHESRGTDQLSEALASASTDFKPDLGLQSPLSQGTEEADGTVPIPIRSPERQNCQDRGLPLPFGHSTSQELSEIEESARAGSTTSSPSPKSEATTSSSTRGTIMTDARSSGAGVVGQGGSEVAVVDTGEEGESWGKKEEAGTEVGEESWEREERERDERELQTRSVACAQETLVQWLKASKQQGPKVHTQDFREQLLEKVVKVLGCGVDPSWVLSWWISLFFWGSQNHHQTTECLILFLLDNNLSPDAAIHDRSGRHPGFPLPLLHFELLRYSPSRDIVEAVLKRNPNLQLRTKSGRTPLQVLVYQFVSEKYSALEAGGDEQQEEVRVGLCDDQRDAANRIHGADLALHIFHCLLTQQVPDSTSLGWMCARRDSVQGVLAKYARMGKGSAVLSQLRSMAVVHSYEKMLSSLDAMILKSQQSAIKRAVTAFLCIRARVHDANVEISLAYKLYMCMCMVEL